MKIKSAREQMALFEQPNAADLLIEYTSFSKELCFAAHLKVLEGVSGINVKKLNDKAFLVLKPKGREILADFLKQLTLSDAQNFLDERSFLCKEAQLKILDFPKNIIRKIFANYCKCVSWVICDEAQTKMLKVFSPQEVGTLCREFGIRLHKPIQSDAFEIFSKEDFAVIMTATSDLSVNMFQRILDHFPKQEAKDLVISFIEQGGTIWDEIQRRVIKNFSKDDAKEILLKHLEKRGFIGDDVKIKIWNKFPKDDALEIFKASSKVEKSVDKEVIQLIIHQIWLCKKELLLNYIGNGVELSEESQIDLIDGLTKEEARDILLEYKKAGGTLCREAKRFLK